MTALRYSLSLLTGLVVLTAASADEARGRIVLIDPDKKEIRLETRAPVRGMLDLKIDAKTRILIGGQPATLDDLAPGRRIRVVFEPRGGKPVAQVIRSLGLNLLQPPHAAQPPAVPPKEGEGVAGTLQRVAVTDREIVVIGPGSDGPKTEITIGVPEKTAIMRDSKKITFDELKEGETATVKTEKRDGKLTAVSIQVGQAAAARSAAPPRRNLIPRLRQALKMADELLREMEEQRTPPPPPPPPERP